MSLTEAAYWTRRLGVLAAGALAIIIIAIIVVISLNNKPAPPEYLTPNFACTDTKDEFLTNKLNIPSLSLASGSDMIFELETETGTVDSLPRIINVHRFNIPGQSLNSQAEAKIIATKLGFEPERIQRRGSAEYIWYDSFTYRTLVVEARNLNFTLTTDYTKNSIDKSGTLPSEPEAIALATNYLKGKGLLFEDYIKQTPQAINIDIEPNGTLSQSPSKADAELIRVDFYRKVPMITIQGDIVGAEQMKTTLEDKLFEASVETIVTEEGRIEIYNFDTVVTFENPNTPNISVYIGPPNKLSKDQDSSTKSVYGVIYSYWPIDPTPCGTYQLIPPSTALELVQQGKGSLVYLNEKNGDDVVTYTPKKVRKFTIYTINIGYYESPSELNYLQPVYIVSGEATLDTGIVANFHYYVPAIDYDLVKDKQIIEEVPTEEENENEFLL